MGGHNDQDGDGIGVFGQILNEDFSKSGGEFQINQNTDYRGPTFSSNFEALSNGKFVVGSDVIINSTSWWATTDLRIMTAPMHKPF